MTAVTRILARHEQKFTSIQPAWLNPPSDINAAIPGFADTTTVFTQDFSQLATLERLVAKTAFGDFPAWPANTISDIVYTLPRGRALVDMMTQCCASHLETGGKLWVAGEINHGIKATAKRLASHFQLVEKVDSARHCALLCASNPLQPAAFDPEQFRNTWPLEHDGTSLQIQSWPGVFNHGSLDDGTALLLENLPEPPEGARVLDLGCGAGVIGACLLTRVPSADIVFADVSAIALRATSATLSANNLRGRVVASDGFSGLDGVFDLVISNPPFHAGRKGNPQMTPTLLAPIRNFLKPRGQLVLVANRHLPYEPWLRSLFRTVERLAVNNRFHVLACRL